MVKHVMMRTSILLIQFLSNIRQYFLVGIVELTSSVSLGSTPVIINEVQAPFSRTTSEDAQSFF
jgi:hypothetical protein